MHGGGYETRQFPLFHVFVRIFSLDPVQNTPFFENITNQILRLNYTQLICKPVRSKNKRLCRVSVSSTSIEKHYYFLIYFFNFKRIFIIVGDNIVLAFEGFKVS